jgi:hypothetical protein
VLNADRLDRAILAQLRRANGSWDVNVPYWMTHIQKELGTVPDYAEIVSAMKRLFAEGLVDLRKHSKEYPGTYSGPQDDWWFFGYYTFEVSITDQGRRFWNVATAPIGFERPA